MRRVRIENSEAIDLLTDAARVRLLEPFMAMPLTIAQAAKRRDMSANSLAYWVKKFVSLGLVEQTAGSGKTAVYRATADEFVFDLTRTMPFEEMLKLHYDSTWKRMLRGYVAEYQRISRDWVMRLYVDEHGLVRQEGVPEWQLHDPERPLPNMALNVWGGLRLDKDVAREFQVALEEVIARFAAQGSLDLAVPEYVVHVGLVRAPEE